MVGRTEYQNVSGTRLRWVLLGQPRILHCCHLSLTRNRQASPPEDWDFRTLCACGAALRAHSPIQSGADMYVHVGHPFYSSLSSTLSPDSITLTLALFSTVHLPSPAVAPAVVPLGVRHTSADLAGAPPIAAYVGVRAPDPGSTNDRRVASYTRAGLASAQNAPHVRTSNIGSRASSAMSGHSTSASTSIAGPSSANTTSSVDSSLVRVLVHVFPFKVRAHLLPSLCCVSLPRRAALLLSAFATDLM